MSDYDLAAHLAQIEPGQVATVQYTDGTEESGTVYSKEFGCLRLGDAAGGRVIRRSDGSPGMSLDKVIHPPFRSAAIGLPTAAESDAAMEHRVAFETDPGRRLDLRVGWTSAYYWWAARLSGSAILAPQSSESLYALTLKLFEAATGEPPERLYDIHGTARMSKRTRREIERVLARDLGVIEQEPIQPDPKSLGLGAVVEVNGERFARSEMDGSTDWYHVGSQDEHWVDWAALTSRGRVEVLSKGWTP